MTDFLNYNREMMVINIQHLKRSPFARSGRWASCVGWVVSGLCGLLPSV